MTDLAVAFEAFHFIRPLVLILLPLIAVIWWAVRKGAVRDTPVVAGLAPHLREALTLGVDQRRRLLPIDGVAAVLGLAILGAAGPSWTRVPDPFVAQTAPLVIVLKVAETMEGTDLAPSRLERAKQKIRDLLELRAGARTALVAYSGTAHSVVPMTDDPSVMQPYLQGLTPDVMPEDGDDAVAALAIAQALQAKEPSPGGILFVTDGLDTTQISALTVDDETSLAALAMLPDGTADAGLDAAPFLVVPATPDDADIRKLDRSLNAAYQRALTQDGDQPWEDRGWWLAVPALMLALPWFRRGWTMRWAIVLVLGCGLWQPGTARADGVADWFFTPDQQGQIAYQRKTYDRAADLFADPMRIGWALYRDGQYAEAAKTFARIDSADAAFVQGMAHIKAREYRDGIAAFELTLQRDPDFPGASENLETAKTILSYVEEAREQSDTGEEQGIGADDVVMDNTDARGADTELEGGDASEALLSTDQWMNTVDTQTGDFLRQRFAIEAATQ
ncbi:VWA domain-containing protein [Pseudoruegeria sp. SK021]|uniref:VWA domain-containing protein n=1 Tax=Pseudoruegeria sp. SK021 TaxID=1933035 RepID=UPI000A240E22|nr:VWA domain-containing protein [Pseudoruegeria sp. SK021]OSP53964.1 hypothetical protein BV911_14965 [Pseudoruegeria sp. SK021]